jgi:hypothetical protein
MLITDFIKIKINKGNIPRYKQFKELKHIKIGDEIDMPIKFISKNSKEKVVVKCDVCGEEYEIQYSTYNDSTKNQTEMYVCRGKCANIKREQTNLELYGNKNCFQNEKMKEKSKETMKEKYGHEHNMQCEKFLNNRKITYLENWGVDNPSKNENIKKKKEETCMKNYGVKSPYQNRDIFRRSRKSANSIKNFKNTDLIYQSSYEKDFLDKYYDKYNIENGILIKYKFDKDRVYHSDFYLPKLDIVVEIKSTYWLNKHVAMIEAKEEYTKKNHNYVLILDKNYDEFDEMIKNLNYPYDKQYTEDNYPIS